MDNEEEVEKIKEKSDMNCPRCGLRSYEDICPNCNAPMLDKTDDEEEEYDWREHKR